MTRLKTDRCERCHQERADHLPGATYSYGKSGFSSGGTHESPVVAVTSGTLSSCVAFIEPGERVPRLTESLPERSLEFFNLRWLELHGAKSSLKRPRFGMPAIMAIQAEKVAS